MFYKFSLRDNPILSTFIIAATLFILLTTLFEPRFASNDDVAMSMVLHGYGIAQTAKPHIFFSNIIWGYIVQLIPTINGILGYSLATLSILFSISWAVMFILIRFGLGYVLSFGLVLLIMARPILFPQFTMNAGLLAMTSVMWIKLYEYDLNKTHLLQAFVFAYIGFLIRSHELILIFAVASPFFPWKLLRYDHYFQRFLLFFLSSIMVSLLLDYRAYQTPEWTDFNEFNHLRAAFTDFGAMKYFRIHPELITKFGYTKNDLLLISNWFFEDSSICSPDRLSSILSQINIENFFFVNILDNFKIFNILLLHPICVLSIPALFSLLFHSERRKIFFSWFAFLLAMMIMTLCGRPGVIRVLLPIVSMLIILPFIENNFSRMYGILVTIIFASNAISMNKLYYEQYHSKEAITYCSKEFEKLSIEDYLVTWGDDFPFTSVYPVLDQVNHTRKIKLYGFGCFSLAPFSVSSHNKKLKNGMIDRLRSKQGILIILNSSVHYPLIETYCRQHFDEELHIINKEQVLPFSIQTLQCSVSGKNND